jgi:hypothetical protein
LYVNLVYGEQQVVNKTQLIHGTPYALDKKNIIQKKKSGKKGPIYAKAHHCCGTHRTILKHIALERGPTSIAREKTQDQRR